MLTRNITLSEFIGSNLKINPMTKQDVDKYIISAAREIFETEDREQIEEAVPYALPLSPFQYYHLLRHMANKLLEYESDNTIPD